MKILLLVASLVLAGCSSKEDPPPPPKAKEGRAETQSIRNTQAIGYSGKAIADKVDAALKANDEQVKKAQKDSEEGKEEKPQ
jgi:thiamine biosynthesis lipoprotein ApbE